jgi:hypothetical protein
MKKVSFDLNREEKNRILEMHQKSTGKQYLNLIKEENQQLNEIAPLIWWALGGAAVIAGGMAAYNWEGTDANKSVKALHDSCEKSKLGKPLQPNSEHEQIANEVHSGISGLDWSGDGEKKLASALSKIKSIPDYCKVASEYQLTYGADMYDDIDGDINFGGWEEFVRVPLSAAVKATEKANNEAANTGGGGEQPGDGEGNGDGEQNGDGEGTPSSNDTMTYKSCSGTYGLGCKDDDENVVWQLQGCLGVKQTGKFGPNTESALKEKTGNKTIDEREVWTLCKDEDPGDKLF